MLEKIAELEQQVAKWQESSANAAGEALALSHERDKLRKQNVLLRDAIEEGLSTYRVPRTARITEALDATQDLAGLVVCDAEPVFLFRRKGVSKDFCTCDKNRFAELSQMPNQFEMKKLYKAKEKS